MMGPFELSPPGSPALVPRCNWGPLGALAVRVQKHLIRKGRCNVGHPLTDHPTGRMPPRSKAWTTTHRLLARSSRPGQPPRLHNVRAAERHMQVRIACA